MSCKAGPISWMTSSSGKERRHGNCWRRRKMSFVAFSPLNQGLLLGKFDPEEPAQIRGGGPPARGQALHHGNPCSTPAQNRKVESPFRGGREGPSPGGPPIPFGEPGDGLCHSGLPEPEPGAGQPVGTGQTPGVGGCGLYPSGFRLSHIS